MVLEPQRGKPRGGRTGETRDGLEKSRGFFGSDWSPAFGTGARSIENPERVEAQADAPSGFLASDRPMPV